MKRLVFALLAIVVVVFFSRWAEAQPNFIRGDCDNDGDVDVGDGVWILGWLVGGVAPVVPDAGDANDNGVVEIADASYVFRAEFSGGPQPPPPYPAPGPDTTPPNFPTGPSGVVDFELTVGDCCPGETVVITMGMSNTLVVDAFSLRITYEVLDLTWYGIDDTPVATLVGQAPASIFFDEISPGVVQGGVVIDFFGFASIPVGIDQALLNLTFAVDPAAPLMTLSPVRLVDDALAVPPQYNLAAVAGEAHLPSRTDGGVFVDTASCLGQTEFRRGDTNEDGLVSIADAVFMIEWLFLSGPSSFCNKTGDVNADDLFDVSDIVFLLDALLVGTGPIPPPYPACGLDPFTASTITCNTYAGGCP